MKGWGLQIDTDAEARNSQRVGGRKGGEGEDTAPVRRMRAGVGSCISGKMRDLIISRFVTWLYHRDG